MSAWRFLDTLAERIRARAYTWCARFRGRVMAWRCARADGPLYLGPAPQIGGHRYIQFLGPFIAGRRTRIEAIDRHRGLQYTPSIVIGVGVSMENDCHIGAINRIEIHDHVLIASRVYISDHSHGGTRLEDLRLSPHDRPVVSKGPVVIESHVWLGEGACVMPGVRIGHHSVVGANAVVTRDIPPYCVAVGCPARIVKSFSAEGAADQQHLEKIA